MIANHGYSDILPHWATRLTLEPNLGVKHWEGAWEVKLVPLMFRPKNDKNGWVLNHYCKFRYRKSLTAVKHYQPSSGDIRFSTHTFKSLWNE